MTGIHVAVIGGGAFGVALSNLAASKGYIVSLWARNSDVVEHINKFHHHPTLLKDIFLKPQIIATCDFHQALDQASYVILAIPMGAMKEVLKKISFLPNMTLISTAKGILPDTLQLSMDCIADCVPKEMAARVCYLSGPSFARELALGLPTALTVASLSKECAEDVQIRFSTPSCRLYRSDDVVGVCVSGALKNVIAIAAGACVGLNLGRNALAALITRGLHETTRLAIKMGANPLTMSGLSGVGDLILSCTDAMSRNYRLGTFLAQGYELSHALAMIGTVVEGANTAHAVNKLAIKYGVDMPISTAVHQVLDGKLKPEAAITSLLQRVLKDEII